MTKTCKSPAITILFQYFALSILIPANNGAFQKKMIDAAIFAEIVLKIKNSYPHPRLNSI
jgi:hypothetical protein